MFARTYGTIQAFFVGFTMVARQAASTRFSEHKTRILGCALLAVYYAVVVFQFAYHGKAVPKEHVSDFMSLFFQVALAPVFYWGFQKLVEFVLRDDVQAAFDAFVSHCRRYGIAMWKATHCFGVRVAMVAASCFRGLRRFGIAFVKRTVVVLAVTAEGMSRGMAGIRRFAAHCVETGQKTQP